MAFKIRKMDGWSYRGHPANRALHRFERILALSSWEVPRHSLRGNGLGDQYEVRD